MNYNSLFLPSGTFGEYSSDFHKNQPFYRSFVTVPHDRFLFRTGDGNVWCEVSADDVRAAAYESQNREPNQEQPTLPSSVRVYRSYNTRIQAGGTTTFEEYLGCEGNPTDNKRKAFWGPPGSVLNSEFKQQHKGIGLFLRMGECDRDFYDDFNTTSLRERYLTPISRAWLDQGWKQSNSLLVLDFRWKQDIVDPQANPSAIEVNAQELWMRTNKASGLWNWWKRSVQFMQCI